MSKSIKFKNNNYLDSSSITHNKHQLNDILNKHFYGYEDTLGTDIYEILRNKMEYGSSLCTKEAETVMFGGGWKGENFGLSIFSKDNLVKHLIWISIMGVYICRYYNGNYEYRTLSWNDL